MNFDLTSYYLHYELMILSMHVDYSRCVENSAAFPFIIYSNELYTLVSMVFANYFTCTLPLKLYLYVKMIWNEFEDEFCYIIFSLYLLAMIDRHFHRLNLLFYRPYRPLSQNCQVNMTMGPVCKPRSYTILLVCHFGRYETYLRIFKSNQIFYTKFRILWSQQTANANYHKMGYHLSLLKLLLVIIHKYCPYNILHSLWCPEARMWDAD